MAVFLAPILNDQQENSNGAPLSGGTVEVYLAGTSTPSTTYSDKAGLVPNTWPITLNTLGVNSQGAVWLTGGAFYKFIIKDSTGVVQRTIDNVAGINDTTVTVDQWVVYQGVPTYVSPTSFTVAGDQTQIFQIRRRVRTQNTGGLIYSTITNSVYSAPNTTVTVSNDSGTLDSGLSQVSYGIISPLQTSLPQGLLIDVQRFTAGGTWTMPPGTKFTIVRGCGGGGGGGGAPNPGSASFGGAGGGGSAGAFGEAMITSPATGPVVIGNGGGGNLNAAGGNGGDTTFAGLTFPGGKGAAVASVISTAGTTGNPGTISNVPTGTNIYGIPGWLGTPGMSLAAAVAVSGKGGDSPFGSGGGAIATSGAAGVNGASASGFGAGGSGGSVTGNNGASVAGGAGASGLVIVYSYA